MLSMTVVIERESNQVAHELVRLARFSPPNVWMESPAEGVVSMIVNE